MKLLQVRHIYECSLKEAKKLVKDKYPNAVIDHHNDKLKKAGFYHDFVVWAKDREALKDRFNCAVAVYKKDDVGKISGRKIPP